MKKLIVLFAIVGMGLMAVGCSGGEAKDESGVSGEPKLKADPNKPASNTNPGSGANATPL